MKCFSNPFANFTRVQLVNMAFYIGGIVCYKFALECMNTCIFNLLARGREKAHTAFLWTVLQSINYATQCIGSLVVGPAVRRMRTNRLLSSTLLLFGVLITVIPILELSTGGSTSTPGSWDGMILFGIFPAVGLCHGVIELIRRVIPNEIVGGDEVRLKRMDASVHVLYEVAGTAGALVARFYIEDLGYALALFVMTGCFVVGAVLWRMISLPAATGEETAIMQAAMAESGAPALKLDAAVQRGFFGSLKDFGMSFVRSVWIGGKLVLTSRSLIWLLPGYTLPLIVHRYAENTVMQFYAKYVLLDGSLAQILVAGSNLGELFGAFFVFLFAVRVRSPLPWLRLDAICILIIWILAFVGPTADTPGWVVAWQVFPAMSLLSFGWASGDVSLAAYVQSRVSASTVGDVHGISPLSAVMAFLYVSYVIFFPVLAFIAGGTMDAY